MNTLSATDLALQHILQSGLAVVRDEPVEEGRRRSVIDALVQIFTDANKGSQALSTRNFLMATEESPAFERFVLFFRYLNRTFGQDLPGRLSEASSVLKAIQANAELTYDAKHRVADLIQDLLSAIARENALSPLVPQREVQISF